MKISNIDIETKVQQKRRYMGFRRFKFLTIDRQNSIRYQLIQRS